jgi:succinate-semialdehyde dehydrogenase/glutarate-semialdehyde dehydrogenase
MAPDPTSGTVSQRPATLPVHDPADGTVVGEVRYADAESAREAADAAARAFPGWSGLPARERADRLMAAAALIAGDADRIGALLSRETGKRLPEGIAEVRFAAEYFRWFAEQVRRPAGDLLTAEKPNRRQVAASRPVGVAVCLSPWNFPVSIQVRKIAAALAAGCTTVSRTSEKAPLAVVEMFGCLREAGIGPEVAGLVHGPAGELTEALLDHPAVRVVSFTGSTQVGRHIMELAARRIVRPLLELGGDAPFLVFADADLDAAIEGAMVAKFRNNGQSCIAANRFLVQQEVVEEFTARLAAAVDAMTMGRPTGDPVPDLGPLIDADAVGRLSRITGEAEAAGARRVTRAFELPEHGCFAAPAVFDQVPDGIALSCSEVFGPVAGIFAFGDEAEALARANDTEMGLAGYLYTRDLGRAWRVAEQLECGIVGCNEPLPSAAFAPMGGIKQSGLGREGAAAGLQEFCDTRYLSWGW